jgi:hypothetical protein
LVIVEGVKIPFITLTLIEGFEIVYPGKIGPIIMRPKNWTAM